MREAARLALSAAPGHKVAFRHPVRLGELPVIDGDGGSSVRKTRRFTTKGGDVEAPEKSFEPSPVNVRVKISALWASMLFVFSYVDVFSLYRPEFRSDLDAGEVGGLTVDQTFLVGATAYVAVPTLMVFGTLVLSPRVNRLANIAFAIRRAFPASVGRCAMPLTLPWLGSGPGCASASTRPGRRRLSRLFCCCMRGSSLDGRSTG
jgi:hypothetical protein